jgi:hypothetical protein
MASHRVRADPLIGSNGMCNAYMTKRDKRCEMPAGQGTNHPGYGACSVHGGNAPQSQLTAAKQMARVMGLPIEVTPHEALLYCVHITAGAVDYCNGMIEELEDAVVTPTVETHKEWMGGEDGGGSSTTIVYKEQELNLWIKARDDYVEKLSRFSKMALDARIDERMISLAENQAAMMRPIFVAVFTDLQLTDEQRAKAPDILRKHLLPLEEPVLSIPAPVGATR